MQKVFCFYVNSRKTWRSLHSSVSYRKPIETALYVSNLFNTVLDIEKSQATEKALRIGFSENFKNFFRNYLEYCFLSVSTC